MPLDSKMVATAHSDLVILPFPAMKLAPTELRRRGVRVEVLPPKPAVSAWQGLESWAEEGILTLQPKPEPC